MITVASCSSDILKKCQITEQLLRALCIVRSSGQKLDDAHAQGVEQLSPLFGYSWNISDGHEATGFTYCFLDCVRITLI